MKTATLIFATWSDSKLQQAWNAMPLWERDTDMARLLKLAVIERKL